MLFRHGHEPIHFNSSNVTINLGGMPHQHLVNMIIESLVPRSWEEHDHVPQQHLHEGHPWMFFSVYWGSLIIIFLVVEFLIEVCHRRHVRQHEVKDVEDFQKDDVIALPDTTYALPLACAVRQVRFPNGQPVPLWAGSITSIIVAIAQYVCVVVIYDWIDKSAPPITEHPDSTWKKNAFTVNLMKFMMIFYLSVFSASDSLQFFTIVRHTLLTEKAKEKHHEGYIPIVLLAFPLMHLICLLITAVVGVSVILAQQSVTMVITGAVGMCFVTQVDDLMWKFGSAAFGVDADLQLTYKAGDQRGFDPAIETLIRASQWFVLATMQYMYFASLITNRLPWLPNPLEWLGLSG